MELKQHQEDHDKGNLSDVLIVPYGIETCFLSVHVNHSTCVNCTLWNWNPIKRGYMWVKRCVNCTLWNWNKYDLSSVPEDVRVNCTLWNWNIVGKYIDISPSIVLIVPYGIETCSALWTIPVNFVLIVPYGIETIVHAELVSGNNGVNCTLWNWNKWKTKVAAC